jgi:hypothetical protein
MHWRRKSSQDAAQLILNWFKVQKRLSCGAVEGLNLKANSLSEKRTVSSQQSVWK